MREICTGIHQLITYHLFANRLLQVVCLPRTPAGPLEQKQPFVTSGLPERALLQLTSHELQFYRRVV